MVPFQSEKGQNFSTKMVPFQKRVKNPQRKSLLENGENSSTKMVPFQAEKGKNSSTKWYHFRKGSKFLNKNGTISENGQNSSTKMVPFLAEKG